MAKYHTIKLWKGNKQHELRIPKSRNFIVTTSKTTFYKNKLLIDLDEEEMFNAACEACSWFLVKANVFILVVPMYTEKQYARDWMNFVKQGRKRNGFS